MKGAHCKIGPRFCAEAVCECQTELDRRPGDGFTVTRKGGRGADFLIVPSSARGGKLAKLKMRAWKRQWVRAAAIFHIDRAGVCVAPGQPCSCPNCVDFRAIESIAEGLRREYAVGGGTLDPVKARLLAVPVALDAGASSPWGLPAGYYDRPEDFPESFLTTFYKSLDSRPPRWTDERTTKFESSRREPCADLKRSNTSTSTPKKPGKTMRYSPNAAASASRRSSAHTANASRPGIG